MARKPKSKGTADRFKSASDLDAAIMEKRMQRRLKAPQQVLLRLPPDLLEEIDMLKGDSTRNKFIISLIESYVEARKVSGKK